MSRFGFTSRWTNLNVEGSIITPTTFDMLRYICHCNLYASRQRPDGMHYDVQRGKQELHRAILPPVHRADNCFEFTSSMSTCIGWQELIDSHSAINDYNEYSAIRNQQYRYPSKN